MQDNPRYDPSDFVAVIHHNTQKTVSPHSGRVVETAGQLVFDVGMEIGIGFPTLGDMLESTVKIFSQMDKYPGMSRCVWGLADLSQARSCSGTRRTGIRRGSRRKTNGCRTPRP